MGTSATPLNSKTAAICSVAGLGEEAMALLRPDLAPREFVALLLEKTLFPDAVNFLAHALPKREAVWWAWVCARRSAGDAPPPLVKAALDATEKWIAQPTDELRRAAMSAAERATLKTAAGCCGLAAFFSGNSLAPPGMPAAPPGEFAAAKAVSGAVMLSALSKEPEKAPEKFRASVAQGLEVAQRIKLWEPKTA